MNFQEACQLLNHWVAQSQGRFITLPSTSESSFRITKKYTHYELNYFEQKWGISFPQDYREFLTTVGAGSYFIGKYGMGCIFHNLEDIEVLSSQIMEDEATNLFPYLFLVVALTYRGDEGGFDLNREGDNFSVFFHEAPPEIWTIETDRWSSFSDWVIKLVSSERDIDIP
ncbi:MAG: SMI1/KNR4 family protein [Chloroflexota bacterium]